MDLYQSGWNPRGVRKAWERCSMDIPSTMRLLGSWSERIAPAKDAVGWFDDNGSIKVLVVDSEDGRRLVMRSRRRDYVITIGQAAQ